MRISISEIVSDLAGKLEVLNENRIIHSFSKSST